MHKANEDKYRNVRIRKKIRYIYRDNKRYKKRKIITSIQTTPKII
jgi:hypothetical protein